jgi:hypothetical protein
MIRPHRRDRPGLRCLRLLRYSYNTKGLPGLVPGRPVFSAFWSSRSAPDKERNKGKAKKHDKAGHAHACPAKYVVRRRVRLHAVVIAHAERIPKSFGAEATQVLSSAPPILSRRPASTPCRRAIGRASGLRRTSHAAPPTNSTCVRVGSVACTFRDRPGDRRARPSNRDPGLPRSRPQKGSDLGP